MKHAILALALCLGGTLSAQQNPGTLPVDLNEPKAQTIYVGRYGYWSDMPVKMAYFTTLGKGELPKTFSLFKPDGTAVFSNQLRVMKNPQGVLAPVGKDYPEQVIYALDFSAFSTPGNYYIGMKGLPSSRIFKIGGKMPDNLKLPGIDTFDQQSGITPDQEKPIVTDPFLNDPSGYPIWTDKK